MEEIKKNKGGRPKKIEGTELPLRERISNKIARFLHLKFVAMTESWDKIEDPKEKVAMYIALCKYVIPTAKEKKEEDKEDKEKKGEERKNIFENIL